MFPPDSSSSAVLLGGLRRPESLLRRGVGEYMRTQLATLSSLPACAGTIPPRTRRSTTLDKIIATFCLLPRRVHAVTLDGFMLKLMCFVYAHNFNLLHKVAS